MSLYSSLFTATSGLAASQRALGVVANNVANANTEGFSRKNVNLETRVLDGEGRGVTVADTTRVADQYLNAELRRQESAFGRTERLKAALDRVDASVFGEPGGGSRGLSTKLRDTVVALEGLANNPDQLASRSALVNAVADLTGQLRADHATVQEFRHDLDGEIKQSIDTINAELQDLHDLNGEFARLGEKPELLDRRDALLTSLAQKLDIKTATLDNDRIAVYTVRGRALLEYTPRHLDYTAAPHVDAATSFGPLTVYTQDQLDPATSSGLKAGAVGEVLVSGGVRADLTPELAADAVPDADQRIVQPLTGGRLAALFEVRDRYLPGLGDQLSETGVILEYSLNKAHNNAVPHPPPQTLTGAPQAGTVTGAFGTGYLTVIDGDGLIAADIAIDVGLNNTPADLEAAINAGLGGLGTATYDAAANSFTISLGTDGSGRPYRMALDAGDSAIAVETVPGRSLDHGFAHYLGLNNLVTRGGGAGVDLDVRADIKADPKLVANAVVDRGTGVPAVGGAGDTRGLRALADAVQEGVPTVARGGIAGGVKSLSGYVNDVVAVNATEIARAGMIEGADRALVEDLRFRQGAVSGVNLDEELSKLQMYQQAYSVSARLIGITSELLDELIRMGR